MSVPAEPEETNWRRRALLLALVAILVVLGAGIGSFILGDQSPPGGDDETTPTPAPTATPTPVVDPSNGTGTPTATPSDTETVTPDSPADTPTATPGDTPDDTPTEVSGGPTTPSPGLELGDDGPLFSTTNLAPGESGQGTLTIRNAADEDGELTISAIDVNDSENGIVDPEADVDDSPHDGELSSYLEVRVSVRDGAGNREYLLGTDGDYVPLSELPSQIPSPKYSLASGEEVTLVTDWRLPSSTGNEVQSDGVSIDVGLTLRSTN